MNSSLASDGLCEFSERPPRLRKADAAVEVGFAGSTRSVGKPRVGGSGEADDGVDYHVPFGGRKGSSYGPREQGRYAAEFYTAVQTAYVRSQQAVSRENEAR